MKRLLLMIGAVGLLGGAVALSGQPAEDASPDDARFTSTTGDRNPWTHLRFNDESENFQFVIVTDRTGGHRANVFSRAVGQINLLQPEFVLSVGDLIEGYTEDRPRLFTEWKEFQGFVSTLEMPFFYVPGNHDITNPVMSKIWEDKFGRRYYHFTYKGVLFLCLFTDEPAGSGKLSPEQVAYFRKVLQENPSPRWTVVAMHKPIWVYGDVANSGWPELERELLGRNYTVFAGHVHRYQKYVRNGMNYYELATTGGGSRLRGVDYGEFDHLVWVTMKDDGPVLANIMLDGILPENLRAPETDEPANPSYSNRQPTHPTGGTVHLRGTPAYGGEVNFYAVAEGRRPRWVASGRIDPEGKFVMSTYRDGDGVPAGEYKVTLTPTRGFPGDPLTYRDIDIPQKYRDPGATPLAATVEPGANDFRFDLD